MRAPYEYAVLRLVPRVEREEFVNVGILFFCEAKDLVVSRVVVDETRWLALWPEIDLALVTAHLDATARICRGGADAGDIGLLPSRERWRWLVAPRSTILQTSPAHGGLVADSGDMDALVARLLDQLVRAPEARSASAPAKATKPST